MRVLVTGGAGFIGSHVVDRLLADEHEVAVLDNLSAGKPRNLAKGSKLYEVDLGDEQRVEQVVADVRPTAILHLAAQKSVSLSVKHPIMDARENVIGSLNLFEAAQRAGVHKLVFASTGGALYGETDQLPTSEAHETLPESPYGIAKLATEHYLRFYEKNHGMQTVVLRMANVFGPRQDPQGEAGVVAIFCSKGIRGERATIFGDGLQTRDYTYVGDVANAFVLALNASESLTVNIGTATETSVLDLIDALQLIVGQPIERQFEAERIGEIRRSCLSADLADQRLGWKASTSLHEGLAETVRYFRSNP